MVRKTSHNRLTNRLVDCFNYNILGKTQIHKPKIENRDKYAPMFCVGLNPAIECFPPLFQIKYQVKCFVKSYMILI